MYDSRFDQRRRDIAAKLDKVENGNSATRIMMFFEDPVVRAENENQVEYTIICYLADKHGRLVTNADKTIDLQVDGVGSLSATSIEATAGVAAVDYILEPGETGTATISAMAEGLTTGRLGEMQITDIEDLENKTGHVKEFRLKQNYPNPFNPSTNIAYALPASSHVNLTVYDITGRKIATLVDEQQPAGQHRETFESGNLSSGLYLYRLETDNFTKTRQMMLVK